MSGCTNKKFHDRLYAYELGLLPDEERREMELHLMECDYCFDQVSGFQKTAELLRQDSDVKQTIKEIAEEETAAVATRKGGRLWPKVVPSFLLAAVILFVLIIQPWQVEIKPTKEAIAAENRLAIICFENVAAPEDPERLGEIIANLLITDLSNSEFVQVVSSQQIFDILKYLGFNNYTCPDRTIADDIARQAKARWMLVGSILQTEPNIVVTAQITEVGSGELFATLKLEGDPDDTPFEVVDKLTVEIKKGLKLPTEAFEEIDRMVENYTTSSKAAYRHFLDGMEYAAKYYGSEAIREYNKALVFDSTFAMAYYRLSLVTAGDRSRNSIEKAVQYSDRVSQKEKYFILSRHAMINNDRAKAIDYLQQLIKRFPNEKEAYYWLAVYNIEYHTEESYARVVEYFNKAIEIDPLYKEAYNHLAYVYNDLGDFEKSIWAINKYISLVPDECNPYDTRGEIYARNGRIDLALESFRKALSINPDFMHSVEYLATLATFKQDYATADSCFEAMIRSDDKDFKTVGLNWQSVPLIYQGRYNEALALIDKNSPLLDSIYNLQEMYYQKALIYRELGDIDKTTAVTEKALEALKELKSPYTVRFKLQLLVEYYGEKSDFEAAERTAKVLRDLVDSTDILEYHYHYALGVLDLAKGNTKAAVAWLEKARVPACEDFILHKLGEAYLASGDLGGAVDIFEGLSTRYTMSQFITTTLYTKVFYNLGLAYEQSHWYERAIQAYEKYLGIMANADPDLPYVNDARDRLMRLKAETM